MEWDRQMDFLNKTLTEAQTRQSGHIVVFSHHPIYDQSPDEEDSWAVIAREKRGPLLKLFETYQVSAVYSGHWHRCHFVDHKGMQMVTTGPVGYPLGEDPSGLAIVKVYENRLEHEYYGLDELPTHVN